MQMRPMQLSGSDRICRRRRRRSTVSTRRLARGEPTQRSPRLGGPKGELKLASAPPPPTERSTGRPGPPRLAVWACPVGQNRPHSLGARILGRISASRNEIHFRFSGTATERAKSY